MLHSYVIFAVANVSIRRLTDGWFRLLMLGAIVAVVVLLLRKGPNPELDLINNREFALDMIRIAMIVILLAMGSSDLPQDISSRTMMLVLSRPVYRHDVILGKWLGLLGAGLLSGLILCVVCGLVSQFKGLPIDTHFLQRSAFLIGVAFITTAVANVLSTRLGEMPIVFISAFYLMGGYLTYLIRTASKDDTLPRALQWLLKVVYYFFPNLQFLELTGASKGKAVLEVTTDWSTVLICLAYSLVFSLLLLVLSILSFRNRAVDA